MDGAVMGAKDDGGPAFPVPSPSSYYGMSLRDWFAGQALTGLATSYPTTMASHVYLAYLIADAMLLARGDGQ
jgi:hypothetical protein